MIIKFKNAKVTKINKKGYENKPYMIKFWVHIIDEETKKTIEKKVVKKYGYTKFKTKKAEELEIEKLQEEYQIKLNETYNIKEKTLISNQIKLYLEESQLKNTKSTMKAKNDIFKNYLIPFYKDNYIEELPTLGNKFVKFIQAEMNGTPLEKSLKYKATKIKPISEKRAINIWQMNKAFLNYLEDKELGIFTKFFKIKPCKKPVPRDVTLTKDDFDNLLLLIPEATSQVDLKFFLTFLFLTGVRKGEALALKYKDIDFNTGEVKIRSTYDSKTGGYGTTKTFSGNREVYIFGDLLETIKNKYNSLFIDKNDMESEELQRVLNTPIFTINGTTPYAESTLRNSFKRTQDLYFDKYGVKITLHDLRRSFGTISLQEGIDMKALSIMLGHKDISTTLETYVSYKDKSIIKAFYEKVNSHYNKEKILGEMIYYPDIEETEFKEPNLEDFSFIESIFSNNK